MHLCCVKLGCKNVQDGTWPNNQNVNHFKASHTENNHVLDCCSGECNSFAHGQWILYKEHNPYNGHSVHWSMLRTSLPVLFYIDPLEAIIKTSIFTHASHWRRQQPF